MYHKNLNCLSSLSLYSVSWVVSWRHVSDLAHSSISLIRDVIFIFIFFYIGDSRKHWNSEWDNMASVSHYSIYCVCFLFLNPIPISPYLMSTTTTTNAQNVHVRAATCFRMAAHLIKWQPQTPGYIMSSADTTDTKSWILNFLLRYL